MTLRLAVLLTNDDTSAFAAQFPNDGQKVVQLLQPLRPAWHFDVVPVKDGVLPSSAQAFDGYVITGSPASVNDDQLPWVGPLLDFIRAVDAARQPLIGLCFGHQAVARALGGQVVRNAAGWGLGTAATHWLGDRPWMEPVRSLTTLMAAHNEQVCRMPEGAERLGGSDFCPIGSMQIGQHINEGFGHALTVGFGHPLAGVVGAVERVAVNQPHDIEVSASDLGIFAKTVGGRHRHGRGSQCLDDRPLASHVVGLG
jgi:GMP synthase-like glutamine amidotransferase